MLLNAPLNAAELNLPGGVTQFALASAEATATAAGGAYRTRRATATQELVLTLGSAELRRRWGVAAQEVVCAGEGVPLSRGYLVADQTILAALTGGAFARRGGLATDELVAQASGAYEAVRPSATAELACTASGAPSLGRWASATPAEVAHDASAEAVARRLGAGDNALEASAYGVAKLNSRVNGFADAELAVALSAAQSGQARRNGQATALVTGDGQSAPTLIRLGRASVELACDIDLTLTTGKRGSATAEIDNQASGAARKRCGGVATATLVGGLTEYHVCRRGAVCSAIFIATGAGAGADAYRSRYGVAITELAAEGSASGAAARRRGAAAGELIASAEATSTLNLMSTAPPRRVLWLAERNRAMTLERPKRVLILEPHS